MRTYEQLTEAQQKQASERALSELLENVLQNGLRFNDKLNGDNFQEAIDKAIEEAEGMETPWFAHEYIMAARYFPGRGHIVDDDGLWAVSEALQGMARCTAEDAEYSEDGDPAVVHNIA